jgi:tetratricopeptide (TPR) repeat protein
MFDTKAIRMGLAVLGSVLLAVPFAPLEVQAQAGGRMRVLVANLTPSGDADDEFGKDLSEELRDQIDIDTHVAMSDDDIDDAAREFDMRLDDLNCLFSQQLAAQLEVPMIFCGTYEQSGDMATYSGRFITSPGGEVFAVEPQTVSVDDIDAASAHVMEFFEATIDKVSQIAFCGMEYNSSNWEGALNYCGRAVELAPESGEARAALARTYLELERFEESLEQFEALLEADPFDINSLESAGYVASQVGDTDAARDYYARYLELNPDNVAIRMRVAYDLAQTGDDVGAMGLLEAGIEQDPENVDLHEQYGAMAIRAAGALQAMSPQPQGGGEAPLSAEAADMFHKAVESLTVVIDARGSEAPPAYLGNVMASHIALGEYEEALALGRRGIELFPDNAQIRSQLANGYNQAGDVDQAIAALEGALEVDPDIENAYARMGQWLLAQERVEEAGEAFAQAAERGEQPVDVLANQIFGYGYNTKDQGQGDFNGAIAAYNVARSLDISPALRSQINFFHGYARYRQAEAVNQPNTLDSAAASLPLFQEALSQFNQAQEYGRANPGSNLSQFVEGTGTFIQIQEGIIARGR